MSMFRFWAVCRHFTLLTDVDSSLTLGVHNVIPVVAYSLPLHKINVKAS